DKSVALQPLEQPGPVGCDHLSLREVDVQVDQPRSDQAGWKMIDRGCGRQLLENCLSIVHPNDSAAVGDNNSVLKISITGVICRPVRFSSECQHTAAHGRCGLCEFLIHSLKSQRRAP